MRLRENYEILLQRLAAVQCFPDVRNGRVKILLYHFRIVVWPKCIYQNILCNTSLLACGNVAEDVSCTAGSPGVRR